VLEKRLRLEAEIIGIGGNHFQRIGARRHARHVAIFDGFQMIGMDAGLFSRLLKTEPSGLPLLL
jgi:hypothetical protein